MFPLHQQEAVFSFLSVRRLMAVPTTIDVMGSLLFHKALTCSTELVEFLQVVVLFGGLGLCA